MISLLEPGNPEIGREPAPERLFWGAVLMQAAYDFLGLAGQLDKKNRERVASDVKTWFASNDERKINSFITVCGYLGLEPEPIRTALFSRRAEIRGALKRRTKD